MGSLRFFLAVSVMLLHLPIGPFHGFIDSKAAVQGFYIISGFYIMLVWSTKYNKLDVTYFYINRFFRLWPIYFIGIILSVITSYYAYSKWGWHTISQWIEWPLNMTGNLLLILTNLFMLFQDLTLFLTRDQNGFLIPDFYSLYNTEPFRGRVADYNFLAVGWSLGLEFTFYLLAPILLNSKKIFYTMFGFSIILNALFWYLHTRMPFDYRFFPFELVWFLFGAYIYLKKDFLSKFIKRIKYFELILLLTFIYDIYKFEYSIKTVFGYYIFLILLAINIPLLFNFSERFDLDKHAGELTYPIYILHLPLDSVLFFFFFKDTIFETNVATRHSIAIFITFIFSILLANLQLKIDMYIKNFTLTKLQGL